MEMLDRFAGNAGLLSATGEAWSALAKARKDLSAARAELSSQIEGRDYNLAQFRQLDQAHLIDGELEELESRQKMLANAVEIKTSFNQIEALFGASGDDRPSLDSALKDSSKLLDKLVTYVPSAAELSSRIESARLELADVLDEIVDRESSVDVSGEALEEVEQRLSLIYDLLKKHSCHDVSELIALRNSLSGSVNGVEELEERSKELEKALEQAEMAYEKAASELSNARSAALDGFSSEICNSIRSLELERSVFDVVIEDATPGPKGKDNILFRFSSSGSNPVDVARCASGGEISRIMLCMKALMARYAKMPAMIFDEIDTGVSGSVADKMGSMICSMGNDMQVFAITHLPQVAAKGNAHYIVRKDYSDNSDNAEVTTSISRITGEDRVNEIARILSGSQITPEAIANAKSLLANN